MARPFFPQGWRRLRSEIERYGHCAVFLDYDGTLTRIRRDPDAAALSKSMRGLLKRLVGQRGIDVGILSGRSLRDLRRRVGIPGVFCSGNHGFEIERGGGRRAYGPARRFVPLIHGLAERLARNVRGIDGARVEDKGLTCSVHYRRCVPSDARRVYHLCEEVTGHWRMTGDIRVTRGKKVYEIRPGVDWDKGKALAWMLRALWGKSRKGAVVYVGDDATDEEAFEMVKRLSGLAIRVGAAPYATQAYYTMGGIPEVRRLSVLLLKEMRKVWKEREQKSRSFSTRASI